MSAKRVQRIFAFYPQKQEGLRATTRGLGWPAGRACCAGPHANSGKDHSTQEPNDGSTAPRRGSASVNPGRESDEDPASSALWGFNPDTRRYVKKSGKVWERLVKSGRSQDPELLQKLQVKALARKKATLAPTEHKATEKPPSKSRAKRAAKIIDSHRSELDGLESDAADEHIRKLLAKRLSLAETASEAPFSSDSEDTEAVSRRTHVSRPRKPKTSVLPLTSRIHLKSQPIPIPSTSGSANSDRRAALRKSLAEPDSTSEEED